MAKETKAEAKYDEGTDQEYCEICTHYQAGLCSKVMGFIDPDAWCKYFERKA